MTDNSRDEVRRWYSGSAEDYDRRRLEEAAGLLLSRHDQAMFLRLLPGFESQMRVLEIGAGTGRFTIPALETGYELTATDVNSSMCEALRKKLEATGWAERCVVATEDVFGLTFPVDHFDLVFSLHVIPRFVTFDDQAAAIKEMTRVLKPGGRLLFNVRNSRSLLARSYAKRPDGGHLTSSAEFQRLLSDNRLTVEAVRGKVLLARGVLDRLPRPLGELLSKAEAAAERVTAPVTWDRFVLARKAAAPS